MKSIDFLAVPLFVFYGAVNATSQAQACSLLNQIKLEINIVASNLVNVATTRTPEGGPYKAKKIICDAGVCDVQQISKVKRVYEPDHPDADPQDGCVAYPDIDIEAQTAEMNMLVRDYSNAARACYTQM